MAGKKNLNSAAKAKNDEFYTQMDDISKEVNCYLEYDQNVFRDKTILLPCDDPQSSNFTNFFAQKFKEYGLKKLISTSYAINSKKFKMPVQLSLWEQNFPQYDPTIDDLRGKIYTLDRESIKTNKYPPDALQWDYLEGDGDFRSDEVKKLRDEADVIITNPPFSLFREFLNWINEGDKKFLIIANKNCITYKEVFPLIKENKIWSGAMPMGKDLLFEVPKDMQEIFLAERSQGSTYKIINEKFFARSSAIWLTNIEHGRRHQPMILAEMADLVKHNKHKTARENLYKKYDNYDAIEVPFTDLIPEDYEGVMGVPITFLNQYCPEQFEIVGITKTPLCGDLRTKIYPRQIQHNFDKNSNVTKLNDGACIMSENVPEKYPYYEVDGKFYVAVYPRILIRHKRR